MTDARTRSAATLGGALLVACVAWAVAIVGAPRASRESASAVRLASTATYMAGAIVCHQRPERSFGVLGAPWPVCARCAGLYVAAAAAVVVLAPLAWAGGWHPSVRALKSWLLAAAALVALAWGIERGGGVFVGNEARAASALPLGAVVGGLLVLLWRGAPDGRDT